MEKLDKVDSRLVQLLDAVEDAAVMMLDVGGHVQTWNAGAVGVLGYSAEEVLGSHVSGFYTVEDAASGTPQQHLELTVQHGRFCEEGWRVGRGGREFWASTVITPLYAGDSLVGFAMVTRDDSEGRRRADQLRHAEERFRLLVESVEEYAIFMLDPEGRVMTWNRGAQRLKGYSANEIVGQNFSRFYTPEDIAAGKPGRELVTARAEGFVEDEGWRVRRDGSRFWANVTLTALREADGSLVGFAKVTRDMSERRAAEQRLVESNRGLQRADAAKNAFLSRMSHELRTPLNAVLGFAQLLELENPRPEQHDSVVQILRAGQHLLDLINEVLDISRIEAGQLPLCVEPVSLRDAVSQTLDLLRPMAAARRIDLPAAPRPTAGGDWVYADGQRLKQVLLNLVVNAIKYNREGGTITLTSERRAEGRIRLSVSDTGPGIAPEKLHLLFEPFERLDAPESADGAGLGLALARRLVEACGGSMGVDSVEGQGSTFWFELAPAEPPAGSDAPQSITAAAKDMTCTVLYIEDNPSNVKLVERILGRRPHVSLTVETRGRTGLQRALEDQPDLILLDLNLPDLRGDLILQELLSDPRTSRIPAVILSADANSGQIERLKAAGAADYLTKPINVTQLLALIDDLADPTRRPGEDTSRSP